METIVSFRLAQVDDCQLILKFINELAAYENMADQVRATEAGLRHWLFDQKKAEVIFVVANQKEVGFALYFYNFSTFLAKPGLHLEDLYVLEPYRHRGYGLALIKELAKIAKNQGCGRMEWNCLDWNQPSIDFYHSLQAKQLDQWLTFRMEESDFEVLL